MLNRMPASFCEERFRGDSVRKADDVRWGVSYHFVSREKGVNEAREGHGPIVRSGGHHRIKE